MQEQDFLIFVTPLRPTALRIGQQFFGSAEDAEDVAQETLLRLWAAREHIDSSRSLEALVATVARNVCVSMKRAKSGIETTQIPIHSAPSLIGRAGGESSSPQSLLEEREDAVWLEHRLKALPEYLSRILRMKQEEQLTNQQIADILGTDPRSVATLISKARHQLFNDLKRRNRNENK